MNEDFAQSQIEFDSQRRNWVMLGIKGSSGIVTRYLSRACLKESVEHPFRFRMYLGRQLKRRGPLWDREANLMDCMRFGVVEGMYGRIHIRPRLSL